MTFFFFSFFLPKLVRSKAKTFPPRKTFSLLVFQCENVFQLCCFCSIQANLWKEADWFLNKTENESGRCSSRWQRTSRIVRLHHPHPRIGDTRVTEQNIELHWWCCKRYFIMRRMDVNKQLDCVFNPTILSPRWRQHVNQSHTKIVGLLKAINSEPVGCVQCVCVCVYRW